MSAAPDPARPRAFGRTGHPVTPICVGTSPLASEPSLYGYSVAREQARATVEAVLDGPLNFLDTSNGYGAGSAEEIIGAALRDRGGVPAGFVLATKVDPDPVTGDFSGARVHRSVEESLTRLGVSRLPMLYLHDPEFHLTFEQAMAPGGAVRALTELRESGVVEHIGVAGGDVALLTRFVATGEFAAVLNHSRWTLVDRSAEPLMDLAYDAGVAFVNGAPYGGGMLVKGPDAQPRYGYGDTAAAVRDAVRAMGRACAAEGVDLASVALQFSLRDLRVTSTVVGFSHPSRLAATLALATTSVPDALWEEIERHVPPRESWLS